MLSEELEELIAVKLGNPTVDPHGDPIPTRDGVIEESETVPLADLEAGDTGVFVRVSDSDPEMLRYLAERSISPGQKLVVREKQPFEGPLIVRIGRRDHALGGLLAQRMRISRQPGD